MSVNFKCKHLKKLPNPKSNVGIGSQITRTPLYSCEICGEFPQTMDEHCKNCENFESKEENNNN